MEVDLNRLIVWAFAIGVFLYLVIFGKNKETKYYIQISTYSDTYYPDIQIHSGMYM